MAGLLKINLVKLISRPDNVKIEKCLDCLKNCSYRFCTMDSLLTTMNGDIENGLVFAGSRVGEINEILPVATIIDRLTQEFDEATSAKQLCLA